MCSNTTVVIQTRQALPTPERLLCDKSKENAKSQRNRWLLIRKQKFETKEWHIFEEWIKPVCMRIWVQIKGRVWYSVPIISALGRCLSQFSTAVMRYHGQGSSYKRKHLIGTGLLFQKLSALLSWWESCGCTQADKLLEK